MFIGEVWDTRSGEHIETGKEVRVNAALSVHCFNHMQEARDVLEAVSYLLVHKQPHTESDKEWLAKQISEILAKLNQVQIP